MSNTISDNLIRLNNAKSSIASAITAKGGIVNTGDGFEDFATDIGTIDTGVSLYRSKGRSRPNTAKYKADVSWVSKSWTGLPTYQAGRYIWNDGINTYMSYADRNYQYILNKETNTWTTMTWNGLSNPDFQYIWTDGDNIYYSDGTTQYVLDISTHTWNNKTWNGLTSFYGYSMWSDGTNIYYSNSGTSYVHYVLNKETSTWTTKTWKGTTRFDGGSIWTDGENIYYGAAYVLNKSTSTWSTKTWKGLTSFSGSDIWTDGDSIYYSSGSNQYVLNKSTSTWTSKTWTGLTSFDESDIWTDGENIYFNNVNKGNYILSKSYVIPNIKTPQTI